MSNAKSESGAPSTESGDATAPEATPQWKSRIETCLECPHSKEGLLLVCGLCNCVMLIKARIPWVKCPEDRWES
jgi:hypothetical protein